ncbi:MAG: tail fiber domain-containing protein [Candidatus Aminicenantes bacterium]|jgi:hypothetical protein
MNKIKRILKINVLAVLLIGFLTVGVYGQEADFKPVADEMIGSSGISWVPKVNYSRLELTISRPDGTVFSKTFDSGSSLYASLSEIFGDSYLDGTYNYELRVTPVLDMSSRSLEVDRYSGKTNEALTQSGGFFVQNGAIVNKDILEPGSEAATGPISGAQEGLSGVKDIVHLDDVIITFSLCVGNDCSNGENFGFDTIRLKENNLRIKFDDTSTSASFPKNDWQITANGSNNGDPSYFRIDDVTNSRVPFTIEAGTPSNTLYVDSSQRIGIGTSTPVVDIHVKQGNTPTLRLEQDGSDGFTPQTWDLAGNEANFFLRDVNSGKLPFRVKPGAPEDSIFIDTDGVGFGTDNPGFPIHLSTNSSTNAVIVGEKDGGATVKMGATSNQAQFGSISDHPLKIVTANITRMSVNSDNSLVMTSGASCTAAGVWTDASSRELKENIRGLSTDEALETLDGLNPVKYNYKVEKDEEYLGFIAEDVPEMVAMKDRKHMTPMDVVAVLTKVVQEQQKTISQLKEKIEAIEKDSQ